MERPTNCPRVWKGLAGLKRYCETVEISGKVKRRTFDAKGAVTRLLSRVEVCCSRSYWGRFFFTLPCRGIILSPTRTFPL